MLSTGTEIHHLGLLSDVYLKKYGKAWVMTRVVLEVDEKKCHMAKKMCFLMEITMLEM